MPKGVDSAVWHCYRRYMHEPKVKKLKSEQEQKIAQTEQENSKKTKGKKKAS